MHFETQEPIGPQTFEKTNLTNIFICYFPNHIDLVSKYRVPLTSEQHSKMMASIERVQESLRQKGWPLLPLHLYTNLQKKANILNNQIDSSSPRGSSVN